MEQKPQVSKLDLPKHFFHETPSQTSIYLNLYVFYTLHYVMSSVHHVAFQGFHKVQKRVIARASARSNLPLIVQKQRQGDCFGRKSAALAHLPWVLAPGTIPLFSAICMNWRRKRGISAGASLKPHGEVGLFYSLSPSAFAAAADLV